MSKVMLHSARVSAFALCVLVSSRVCAPIGNDSARWTTYETSIGYNRHVDLSGGNSMELNTATRLRVSGEKVHLEHGEAFFRADRRPLQVNVGNVNISADHASFSIYDHGRGKAEVMGFDGPVRVRFTPSDGADAPRVARRADLVLRAGEIATIRDGAMSIRTVSRTYLQRKLLWRYGMLEFVNEPIENIAAEFNRYSRTRLVIDDDSVRKLRLGGRFSEYDLKTFIATVCRLFPLHSQMRQTSSGPVVGLRMDQAPRIADAHSPAIP